MTATRPEIAYAHHAVVKADTRTCRTCRGTGTVMVAYAPYPADSPFVACPDCDPPPARPLAVSAEDEARIAELVATIEF